MGGSYTYKGKHVVLGVTGGIAAYKVPELIRALQRHGIIVEVIMTKAACEFVTSLTLREITGLPVHTEMFAPPVQWQTAHISLARKANLLAIIPATANIIGKIASGIADDLLTTTVMATRAPVLIAPAMNTAMYENPVFRRNLEILSGLGYRIVPAATGDLLCGEKGAGRLASLDVLEEEVLRLLKDLKGRIIDYRRSDQEYLDPVVFSPTIPREDGLCPGAGGVPPGRRSDPGPEEPVFLTRRASRSSRLPPPVSFMRL